MWSVDHIGTRYGVSWRPRVGHQCRVNPFRAQGRTEKVEEMEKAAGSLAEGCKGEK